MDFSQFMAAVNTNVATHTLTVNGNLSTSQLLLDNLNIGAKDGASTVVVATPIDFGPVSNVHISGGTSYDVIYTDGNGNLSFGNLQTLTQLDGFNGNNISLGSNITGSFDSALTFTTSTKVTDAIADLNQLLGNITNSTGSTIDVETVTVNGTDVYANISSTSANVLVLQSNAVYQADWLSNLDANLGTATTNITTLFSNAATQAGYIDSINANVLAANSAISVLQSNVSTLFSNAASQDSWLTILDANLGTATTNITTLFGNAATQAGYIDSINANVSAANAAIVILQSQVYSNANAASYLTVFNGNINAGNIGLSGDLHVDYISSNVNSVVAFTGTTAITLPVGNDAERPVGAVGDLRFNTQSGAPEYYTGTAWVPITNTVTDQQIVGDGGTTIFTLDQEATHVSVLVSINGTLQKPNTGAGGSYTVSGNQITFVEAPLSDDVIDIRFLGGIVTMNNVLSDDLTISGNLTLTGLLSAPQVTKASNANGTVGQMCWDANYIYVCTATNTWKRSPLTGGY
jgi:hypothetical protein